MKKAMFLLTAVTCLATTTAFAEESTNCSNAHGTLRREEIKVWGTNPVVWRFNGEVLSVISETFDDSKKVILEDHIRDTRAGRYQDTVFASKVTVFYGGADEGQLPGRAVKSASDYVICNFHTDPFLD